MVHFKDSFVFKGRHRYLRQTGTAHLGNRMKRHKGLVAMPRLITVRNPTAVTEHHIQSHDWPEPQSLRD